MYSIRLNSPFKTLLMLTLIIFSVSCNGQSTPSRYSILKEGDILFQDSESQQGEAIKLATHSEWTHVGMLVKRKGQLMVLEGVQPVCYTPVDQWIKRGKGDNYEVKRLKNKALTERLLAGMRTEGDKLIGTDYDIYFNWADNQMYCSELVWKVYRRGANIELCPLRTLKSFDLNHPLVKMIMKERYGNNIPYNEQVVAPSDLYDSELLESVVISEN